MARLFRAGFLARAADLVYRQQRSPNYLPQPSTSSNFLAPWAEDAPSILAPPARWSMSLGPHVASGRNLITGPIRRLVSRIPGVGGAFEGKHLDPEVVE